MGIIAEKLKRNNGRRVLSADNNTESVYSSVTKETNDKNINTKKCSIKTLLANKGFVTADPKKYKMLDEYRQIKRPILMNAFGKCAAREENANLVMITSSVSGEGKTYTTLNLALSMAMERDTTVLVIDCDDVRSKLTKTLHLGRPKGLIDLLLGRVRDVDEIIINTDIEKLSVIPSGDMNPHSTELFASERMKSMLAELSERYADRVILFDTPPLLETSQSKVLAHSVGQVLIVVEEGKTEQKAVIEAIDQLDQKKIIGTILNKRRYNTMGDYYSDYYAVRD